MQAPVPIETSSGAVADEELHCPLCEYDLRGLIEPCCPECGYRFDWDEIRDRKRHEHPYLFEHHPRRNLWSFVRTAVEGFKPSNFWCELTPQTTPHRGRLFVYWLICTASPALLGGLLLIANALARRAYPPIGVFVTGIRPLHWPSALPATPAFVNKLDLLATCVPGLLITSGLLLFWTLCTHLSLLVFQESLSRAKIRPIHVARCVRYSFDIGIWFAALGIASLSLEYFSTMGDTGLFLVLFAGPLLLMAIVRLLRGYQLYLKFDHALWVVLSTQVIAGLALLILLTSAFNLRWMQF